MRRFAIRGSRERAQVWEGDKGCEEGGLSFLSICRTVCCQGDLAGRGQFDDAGKRGELPSGDVYGVWGCGVSYTHTGPGVHRAAIDLSGSESVCGLPSHCRGAWPSLPVWLVPNPRLLLAQCLLHPGLQ